MENSALQYLPEIHLRTTPPVGLQPPGGDRGPCPVHGMPAMSTAVVARAARTVLAAVHSVVGKPARS